ncbi:MAG: type I-E CRISPR-associated protein Cas7/Cse4/CasC [Candidatus Bipolaricaulota bacterium]
MKNVLEIHILQNFAPSNLNRDDTGSPKDAIFGGTRRGRISSQCLKRAMREHFRESGLLVEEDLALRTKRVVQPLAEALHSRGRSVTESEAIIALALSGLELKVSDGKSQYLLFLAEREIERVAGLIDEHWDSLVKLVQGESGGEKASKKAAKTTVPPELVKAMGAALDGGKAVDVALFGRMVADRPEAGRDAAAQVAHAISTHKVDREFDFYTAVDDLQPDDTAGADMLGTVEFDSACYYRYALIDLDKLVENLQGDRALALKGVEAFLCASVHAEPTGKQNSFAAHNPPSLVAFTVRKNASPRSLANAFERPVRPGQDGLVAESAQALVAEWVRLDAAYGDAGAASYLNVTPLLELALPGVRASTIDSLITQTMHSVQAVVGE